MDDNDELAQKLLGEYNLIEDKDDEQTEQTVQKNNTIGAAGIIFMAFIWIEGLRAGSKLVWIPQEENLYYVNGQNKNGTACTCIVKECDARVFLNDNGMAKSDHTSFQKSHESSLYPMYLERHLFKWMKDRCRSAPASATLLDIYEEAVRL